MDRLHLNTRVFLWVFLGMFVFLGSYTFYTVQVNGSMVCQQLQHPPEIRPETGGGGQHPRPGRHGPGRHRRRRQPILSLERGQRLALMPCAGRPGERRPGGRHHLRRIPAGLQQFGL